MGRTVIPDDGFEWCERYLDAWSRWMRDPELKLSAPERSPAFLGETHDGWGDPQECYELAGHDRAIEVIQAAVEGLTPVQWAAVLHVHFAAVYRFRFRVQDVYLTARMRIGIRLRANDFTPGLANT